MEPSCQKMAAQQHDDLKRRRLNLKEQRDAYIHTMADPSMVFDGRDILSQYKLTLRESEKAKSELLSLCLVYRPVKNCKVNDEKRYSSPPPASTRLFDNSDATSSTESESQVPNASDDAPRCKLVDRKPGNDSSTSTATTEDTSATAETTENTSSRDLFRRKKSSPKHRCAEKNRNLKSAMKEPKYLRSRNFKCTSQMATKDIDQRREKLVHFRGNVEVYCYKSC
jgi:hypothetical protein